jgi:hypothetical protein
MRMGTPCWALGCGHWGLGKADGTPLPTFQFSFMVKQQPTRKSTRARKPTQGGWLGAWVPWLAWECMVRGRMGACSLGLTLALSVRITRWQKGQSRSSPVWGLPLAISVIDIANE